MSVFNTSKRRKELLIEATSMNRNQLEKAYSIDATNMEFYRSELELYKTPTGKKSCRMCGETTDKVCNINFKAIPICNDCALHVMRQTANVVKFTDRKVK